MVLATGLLRRQINHKAVEIDRREMVLAWGASAIAVYAISSGQRCEDRLPDIREFRPSRESTVSVGLGGGSAAVRGYYTTMSRQTNNLSNKFRVPPSWRVTRQS